MEPSFLSVLPPVVVLVLGYLTRKVPASLVVGIIVATLTATQFSFTESLYLTGQKLWENVELYKLFSPSLFWSSWNLFICIFLFILGIFVTLICHSGGAYAYGTYARAYIKDKRSAETSSLFLSLCLFIDDYFSSLTVGSVMQPLTDSYKVPRAKLAFLVDSMSAPLAILCPFSSWVAAIIGFLRENGVASEEGTGVLILASPFVAYLHTIPFIFYSFILMSSSWLIVRKSVSFGLMGKYEKIAEETGNLQGGRGDFFAKTRKTEERNKQKASMKDFFVPIFFLLLCVVGGMAYSGGASLFGGDRFLLSAFQNANAAIALFVGGSVALLLCTIYLLIRGSVYLRELPSIFAEGFMLMLPAIIVLILAWTLGDILRTNLQTGEYLAHLLIGSLPVAFLPFLFFTVSGLIALATGSSWGTAPIVFSIAIPMVFSFLNQETVATIDQLPILFPTLGAILSGCVAGDHISPVSDTTIMSATSTGTPHIDHVQTQLTYAIPIILVTAVAYLLTGFLVPFGLVISSVVSTLIGIALSFTFFLLMKKRKLSQS